MKKIVEFKYIKMCLFILLSFSYYFFIDFFNKYLVLRNIDLNQYLSSESIVFSFIWIFTILIILYISNNKFMSFIITYSPHSPYEKTKIECQKNLQDIERLYLSLNEEEICALSSARETDNMFKLLLERLNEDDKLDDTVIVAFSDHPNNVKLNEGESEKLNKTIFFIYNSNTRSHQINDISSTINILPTIKNLFDLKGDFVYPGCDLLNCDDNYIIFNDFTYFDGEHVNSITEKQKQDIDYSKNLLISDYYKKSR